mmetsp:Transcript_20173/g.35007  ORF Transcript_20173/g.35007 Transcript_20173/m.35007 type:complete len:213 (-) Transcript_20173:208-846(-)
MVTTAPSNVADRMMVPTGWKVKNTVVTVGGRCLPPQLIALNEYIVAKIATYQMANQGNSLPSKMNSSKEIKSMRQITTITIAKVDMTKYIPLTTAGSYLPSSGFTTTIRLAMPTTCMIDKNTPKGILASSAWFSWPFTFHSSATKAPTTANAIPHNFIGLICSNRNIIDIAVTTHGIHGWKIANLDGAITDNAKDPDMIWKKDRNPHRYILL